jgi:predicted nuclease of restriction endonuclease-like (RecB) superfamily
MQIKELISNIDEINLFFTQQVAKQVDTSLSLRNWLIGFYLVEYEQLGADRALYGTKLYKTLAKELKVKKIKGLSFTNLHLFKQFYQTYPQIVQTLSEQFKLPQNVIQKVTENQGEIELYSHSPDINLLLNQLSFSHFIEFIKCDTPLQRAFYETFSIRNQWTVRDLQRARNSLLFERTGLSTDKESLLANTVNEQRNPSDFIRNPYILEFLGLSEKTVYKEADLEEAIITHLHDFLIELGKGFCFEARQKRITFDNTHYRIDLVFYHRFLKSHILIDLKIGEFTPADAGQMNMYLHYYQENEMNEGDNPPVGIILCAGKNENLVKYATAGMSEQLFVSKYLIQLPDETELKAIIDAEQAKKHF